MTDDPNTPDESDTAGESSSPDELTVSDESDAVDESTVLGESSSGLGRVEYDPTTDAYYTCHAADDAPPSTVVPRAMAAITGRGIEDLRPLQEVLDPDALDDVFDGELAPDRPGEVEVSFDYVGHAVTVGSSGVVVLEAVEAEE